MVIDRPSGRGKPVCHPGMMLSDLPRKFKDSMGKEIAWKMKPFRSMVSTVSNIMGELPEINIMLDVCIASGNHAW
jgi:hypothetical protein